MKHRSRSHHKLMAMLSVAALMLGSLSLAGCDSGDDMPPMENQSSTDQPTEQDSGMQEGNVGTPQEDTGMQQGDAGMNEESSQKSMAEDGQEQQQKQKQQEQQQQESSQG
ncbi:hypothetical protein GCM10007160_29450 [Litchfieldella qijiaojingensis]|uniref:Uncharacterized protein n=1 Tax=Litchfieldella qijiaojingensis TaxID=980347 RepID=A0ABQ2Z280_9GAMM|nr:hypothetical protein [Halomonas qijiaojingensis]GGX99953.1 hypothetical protein GCM10007160_29450 [Halomonas qijiaojingensis]